MLKESLLGWGGVNYKQEKIVLDTRRCWARGMYGTSTLYNRGQFYKWTHQDKSYYTILEDPYLGDRAFPVVTSNSSGKIVEKPAENQLIIWDPDDQTMYTYTKVGKENTSNVYGTTVYTERIYMLNLSGQKQLNSPYGTNKYFDLKINGDTDTFENEKYFFDKVTQCVVRIAYSKNSTSYGEHVYSPLYRISIDLIDPNNGTLLDHKFIAGYSTSDTQDMDFGINCRQGLFSFYLNGYRYYDNDSTTAISTDAPRVYVYSTRYHHLFNVDLSSIININYSTTASSSLASSSLSCDKMCGVYNPSSDFDDISDIVIGMSVPAIINSVLGTLMYYPLHVDFTKNPSKASIAKLDNGNDATITLNNLSNFYTNSMVDYWLDPPATNFTTMYYAGLALLTTKYFVDYSFIPFRSAGGVNVYDYKEGFFNSSYDSSWEIYVDGQYITYNLSNYYDRYLTFGGSYSNKLFPQSNGSGKFGKNIIMHGIMGDARNHMYSYTTTTIDDFTEDVFKVNTVNEMYSTYAPRYYCGPKIPYNPTKLENSGIIASETIDPELRSPITIEKVNNDVAYAFFSKYCEIGGGDVPTGVIYDSLLCVVSETHEGALCRTLPNGSVIDILTFKFKGKTYYCTVAKLASATSEVGIKWYPTAHIINTNSELALAVIGDGNFNSYVNSSILNDKISEDSNHQPTYLNSFRYQTGMLEYEQNEYKGQISDRIGIYDMHTNVLSTTVNTPNFVTSDKATIFTSYTSGRTDIPQSYTYVIPYMINTTTTNVNTSYFETILNPTRNSSFEVDYIYLLDTFIKGGTKVPPVVLVDGDSRTVTLTIESDPSDATVTFSGGIVSGNSCTLNSGEWVTYTVQKAGYAPKTQSTAIEKDTTITVSLANYVTLTIESDPSDATVTFSTSSEGAIVSGNTITVGAGSYVTYTVSKVGYSTYTSASIQVLNNTTLNVGLSVSFPVNISVPTTIISETQVAAASGNQYTTYSVTEDGWYRIDLCGAGTNAAYKNKHGGYGGKISYIAYLLSGMTCLLWSGTKGVEDYGGSCGFPGTQDNRLGGIGSSGSHSEYGGGGGGPLTGGRGSHDGAGGGAGSGFIAGFTTSTALINKTFTLGDLSLNMNDPFSVTEQLNFYAVTTYVLGAGGGGPSSDEGSNRASGAGGGAFGNGGTTHYPAGDRTGPAGENWGRGEDGARYGEGTSGAWGVADFSRLYSAWGRGGGNEGANGYVTLYKITEYT